LRQRIWIAGLVLLLALGLGYRIAIGVMIARAVLPPHSTRTQVLMALVRPPYQMAAPHHTLRKEVLEFFKPRIVHAQVDCGGGVPCGGVKSQKYIFDECTNGPYCPSCTCVCTVYHCVPGSASDTCDDSYFQPPANCQGSASCQAIGACTQ